MTFQTLIDGRRTLAGLVLVSVMGIPACAMHKKVSQCPPYEEPRTEEGLRKMLGGFNLAEMYGLPKPTIDYVVDADFKELGGGLDMHSKHRFYSAGDNYRMESRWADFPAIMIRRSDLGLDWSLDPKAKIYVEFNDQDFWSKLSLEEVERMKTATESPGPRMLKVGTLSREGIHLTRYELQMPRSFSEKSCKNYGGYALLTPENIIVEGDISWECEGVGKVRSAINQTIVEIGPLPPSLFDIPEGYTRREIPEDKSVLVGPKD